MADLFTYLPLSKANPGSVEFRQKLQLASWMSLWPLKLEKYRYPNSMLHSWLRMVDMDLPSALLEYLTRWDTNSVLHTGSLMESHRLVISLVYRGQRLIQINHSVSP